jgi:uncharacterized protein YkwD
MKPLLTIFAICALSACMGGGGSDATVSMGSPTQPLTPITPPITTPTVPTDGSFAGMLNGVRADNGSAPLTYDARLGRAAQAHADDMLAMGRMTHTGSDGSNAGQRITREGYVWRTWGENVARGYPDEAAVLNGWVNSPGHQANNINPNFEDFALAKAGSGRDQYWALVFASER